MTVMLEQLQQTVQYGMYPEIVKLWREVGEVGIGDGDKGWVEGRR
jgi:hypothetical protein